MKSEKAKELIEKYAVGNSRDAAPALLKKTAIICVELAEQEAEERVRKRAIEAFCEDCPLYNHAGNCPDCSALNAFKQRLNEE
ncbi:hypothetical protein [Alistipes putredinis]|uniref:hypothetical protein n=1 Tax=Alistipes putredinis TaxID=28117 RepID=UPI003AEF9B43